jgi:hypothetical protein
MVVSKDKLREKLTAWITCCLLRFREWGYLSPSPYFES